MLSRADSKAAAQGRTSVISAIVREGSSSRTTVWPDFDAVTAGRG